MDNDLQFKYKYLKYKFKYVQLKKQYGGGDFNVTVINNDKDTENSKLFVLDEENYDWRDIIRRLKIPENVQVYYLDHTGKKKFISDNRTYEKAYDANFGGFDTDIGSFKLYYEIPQRTKDKEAKEASERRVAEQLAAAEGLARTKAREEAKTRELIDSIQNSLNDFQIYNTKLETTNPPGKKGRIKNIFPNEFVDITDVKIEFNSTQHGAYHNVRTGKRGQYLLSEGDLKWMTINLHLNNKRWEYQVSIFKYENTQGNMHNFSRYVFSVNKDLGGPIVYEENPDDQLAIVKRTTFDKEQIQSLLVDTIFTEITAPMSYSIRRV